MKVHDIMVVGCGIIAMIHFGQKAIDNHIEKNVSKEAIEKAKLSARADFYERLYKVERTNNDVFARLFGKSSKKYGNERIVVEAEEIVDRIFRKEYL